VRRWLQIEVIEPGAEQGTLTKPGCSRDQSDFARQAVVEALQ